MEMRYICIDLKSFYASCECVERGYDPLDTNLVVADESRTEKTICLAVTPSLKRYGVPGRPRLFEVIQRVNEVNGERLKAAPCRKFTDSSFIASELDRSKQLKLDFIIAPPHMRRYMEISSRIYGIYLRYIAPEDIHIYSVDEVFIDVGGYLSIYRCTAHELAIMLIREVLKETGITATAGVGTNLFLAKVAMDIVAKKMPADKDGVRIAELDEHSFREKLWDHTPITDFWRIGKGTARRLAGKGLFTMGDVAAFSEHGEDELFRMFGVNAELLIDHAWGREPCTIKDIKSYEPTNHSMSSGQVLTRPYGFEEARLVTREMAENLVLDMVRKNIVADHVSLSVGYDHTGVPQGWNGEFVRDFYGRIIPKPAGRTMKLNRQTYSLQIITDAILHIFDTITDRRLFVRRINISADNIVPRTEASTDECIQYSLFDDVEALEREREEKERRFLKEDSIQRAILEIKTKYGKNSILKGMNFLEGATARERNAQVGGHKA